MAEEENEKARDAFYMARGFLENAKWVKYFAKPQEADPHWIATFVAEARRYNQCGVYHRRKAKELANV